MKIKVIRFDENIELPIRAHRNDSGADVFSTIDTVIHSGEVVKIPIGFGLELPDGYDAVVNCKSGLSSKGIWASNAPIDAGYRGEIHAILHNNSNEDFEVNKGMKVGQLVVRPIIYADFVENFNEEERGAGAFGSTGK